AWLAAHRRQLHELPFAPMAVSASDIRQRLAAGAATDGLLPEPVAAYIATHHLYR
ncbi:nicotinate-nicotinamide nucleotide adenylyltransferase, partial [Bordetella pertussis]